MKKKQGEGIIKISDLFEKYTHKFTAPQSTIEKAFQEVVTDLFGVEIPNEQCSYTPSTRTLAVSVSGPHKSEILMRKDEILAHLKGRLGEKNAPNHII